MNKRGALVCIILITILFVSSCKNQGLYEDGVYYGQSQGYYSNIKIQVTIHNGKINDITILEHEEPEILANIVFEKLPPKIIKHNGADVDGISGATYTSKSLLEAVDEALSQAIITK